jgi:beta-lactamase class A
VLASGLRVVQGRPTGVTLLAAVVVLATDLEAQIPASAIPGESTPREGFAELRAPLEERIARHRGVAGVVVLDSRTGEHLSIRGEEPFPSASLIKLPILVELMYRVDGGDVGLDDPLSMLELDRAPGSGMLRHLTTPFSLTVRDAALLMIALSDNTATNLLLEKLGPRSVGVRMETLGMPETRVFRKVFGNPADSFDPAGSEQWGFGVTTPMDQARLLGWIHRGDAVSPELSAEMLRMLEAQFYRNFIPRHLPPGVRVALKSGFVSAARNDCGIVFGPEREYVICVMTRENEDTSFSPANEAEGLIADLSGIVFRALNPS